jgi:hypothetical protein
LGKAVKELKAELQKLDPSLALSDTTAATSSPSKSPLPTKTAAVKPGKQEYSDDE